MLFMFFRQLKSSNLVTLSIENESMDDKQIRILTLCHNCNTLVSDINGHAKSGVCDSEAYLASDDSQNSISNRQNHHCPVVSKM